MSLLKHFEIIESDGIRKRMIAAAAQSGVLQPDQWWERNKWAVPQESWTTAWANSSDMGDKGLVESLITDTMCRDAVSRLEPKPWVQPTGGHDAYGIGAYVTHNGATWRSLIAANVWEPGQSGWERMS